MDKFYIIGVRHNPQLGSYLSKVIVAASKVNKASITAKFEEYGSVSSLKFTCHPDATGKHYCKNESTCVYGSYSYYGFSSKEAVVAELNKWVGKAGLSNDRALAGLKLVEAA